MRSGDYIRAIDVLRDEGKSPKVIVAGLKSFLSRRNASHMLEEITRAYERHARHGYRPEILRVETAHDVRKVTLEAIHNAAGVPKERPVMHKINPKHIGGYRTLYNHVLTDTTLEARLKNLRTKLLQI